MRVGQGFDVHPLADDDRPLVLGGAVIPQARGLAGHSDGDVVLHAIVDALLGAAGLGDIGQLVGVDTAATAGADSALFVSTTLERLTAAGWRPVNVDCTVIAQHPRVAPHYGAIRHRIGELLGLSPDATNVKATTTDRLGSIGRGEGIACLAVALIAPR